VAATEPETGETSAKQVEQLHLNHDTDLTNLTVQTEDTTPADGAAEDTTAVLHTTQSHPFWDRTLGEWVDAGDLVVGHRLLTSQGDTVTVTAVHNYSGGTKMYDLTVADIHTYYVIAGDTPVLVHNCSRKLGENLRKSGEYPDPRTVRPDAHHIVPERERESAGAQAVLQKIGLDIDSSFNGVWLGRQAHQGTFNGKFYTTAYPQWISDEIVDAYSVGGAREVMKTLSRVRRSLAKMNDVYGKGAV
jgi:hypothetical protein